MVLGWLPWLAAVLVLLIGGLTLILIIRLLRSGRRATEPARPDATSPNGALGQSQAIAQRPTAIVEQMDVIEKYTRRRLNEILTAMVESSGWQALIQQIDELFADRLVHLRALAGRAASGLSTEAALRHTLEAYSLSRLMLSLHEQLVAQSAIVTQVLDDWFKTHRNISISQFESHLQLDCARILLLDLDYAQPAPDLIREQLNLAEQHCQLVAAEADPGALQAILAEITLRRQRLAPK